MKKKRYSEEQIVKILKEAEAGAKIRDLARKYGFAEQTFYGWKKKYDGMSVSDVTKLKGLEEENRKLKKLLAETMLDLDTAKEIIKKNF